MAEPLPSPDIPPAQEQTREPMGVLEEVKRYTEARILALRPAVHAGVGTTEEVREAHAWLGFLRGLDDYDQLEGRQRGLLS